MPEDSSIPNLPYTVSPNSIAILFDADSHIDLLVSEIDRGKICRLYTDLSRSYRDISRDKPEVKSMQLRFGYGSFIRERKKVP